MVEQRARDRAVASFDAVIATQQLVKTYQFHRQQAGFLGAFRSLLHREYQTRVAVKGVDLSIRAGEERRRTALRAGRTPPTV